jgi:acylpyruvate hydrolase
VVNQETELGVVVGKTCRNVTEEEAKKAIGGYCLALDMTEVKHLV